MDGDEVEERGVDVWAHFGWSRCGWEPVSGADAGFDKGLEVRLCGSGVGIKESAVDLGEGISELGGLGCDGQGEMGFELRDQGWDDA